MKKNTPFTLLELILAMGILTIIMVIMLSFFSAAQKAWMASSANAEIYENARVAMDLMTRDLQAALYNDENSAKGIYPFWHESDSKISFISTTNIGDAADLTNIIREIKYARSNGSAATNPLTQEDLPSTVSGTKILKGGWLVRSATGVSCKSISDPNNPINPDNKYNFDLFPRSNPGGNTRVYKVFKEILGGIDITKISSQDFNYIVPYVVDLKFTCYNNRFQDMMDLDGNGISGGTIPTQTVYNYPITTAQMEAAEATPFPYAVEIKLVLLDRNSWNKWVAMGGNVATPVTSDSGAVKTFREAHQRTFTTMIYLGTRNSINVRSSP